MNAKKKKAVLVAIRPFYKKSSRSPAQRRITMESPIGTPSGL